MQRVFGVLNLCVVVLTGLSCISSQNIQENHSLPAFLDRPRVFYGETGDPSDANSSSERCEKLLPEELAQIQRLISEKTQTPIWFVRVPLKSSRYNRSQIWVYLIPDITNRRLRSGLAYNIYALGRPDIGPSISPPWRYIQVSLPGETFSANLDTPKACDLPFPYPSRQGNKFASVQEFLSKEEIINIVDYVRNPSLYLSFKDRKVVSTEHLPEGGIITRHLVLLPPREKMAEIVVSQPLLGIQPGTNEIIVTFGFIHSGLFARGYSVKLKVTDEGYELIEWSFWIS